MTMQWLGGGGRSLLYWCIYLARVESHVTTILHHLKHEFSCYEAIRHFEVFCEKFLCSLGDIHIEMIFFPTHIVFIYDSECLFTDFVSAKVCD